MIRILLVDDHAVLRQSLAFLLEQEDGLEVVAQAGSMAEARGVLCGVDVAVVDLKLPDGDGVELVKQLRAADPPVAVLVLTASQVEVEHARAVEAGAAGVLHKFAQTREVISAVRRVAAGEQLMTRSQLVAMVRLAGRVRERKRDEELLLDRLTDREREVLQALAGGLSDQEIADRLCLSYETVRTHMKSILRKLGVESRLQALLLAARHGTVSID